VCDVKLSEDVKPAIRLVKSTLFRRIKEQLLFVCFSVKFPCLRIPLRLRQGVLTAVDLLLGSVKHHVLRLWFGVVPTGVLSNPRFDSVGVCEVLLHKYNCKFIKSDAKLKLSLLI
jgi:hypothetical protein